MRISTHALPAPAGNRRSAFETLDQPALRALPATPFQFAQWKKAKPNIDYHVEFDGHYYSVPHALVGQVLELRVTPSSLECFAGGRRGGACAQPPARRFSTLTEHMPASHQAHRQWSPSKLIAWGATVGPHTERVVAFQLERMPHPEQGYRACLGLMRLAASTATSAGGRRHPRRRARAMLQEPRLDAQDRARSRTAAGECAATGRTRRLPDAHANLRGAHYYH